MYVLKSKRRRCCIFENLHKTVFTKYTLISSVLADFNFQPCQPFQALIYKEFFSEGDMEKARGKRPPSSFDRERVEIPTHQISFVEKVAMPVYKYVTERQVKGQRYISKGGKMFWPSLSV